MPKAVLDQWYGDRARWLRRHGIDPDAPSWGRQLQQRDPKLAHEFLDAFWNSWHDALDASHGACVLRQPELAEIVAKSLHHFDGERCVLLDFVVMPNHAHVLVSFPDEDAMLAQCESWKHFTATQINRRLKQQGRLWQQDAFDHLVRNERQFEYLRGYIAANPEKARLRPGEYVHYSKDVRAASRGA
jgi:putative transposase